MGYANYNRLRINKKRDNRKNPVATITIPYSIIESLKWKDGDIITFQPYSTKNTQEITMINLNKCPENQMGGEFLKIIGGDYKKRVNFEKLLRQFPKKTKEKFRKFVSSKKIKKQ